MPSRPWRGQLREPTSFSKAPKNQGKRPNVNAKIDWVHGYKGYNARSNLRFQVDGSLAYFAAGLGIVCDPSSAPTQRHFDKHSDAVTAIAYAPDRRTVATGEVGQTPSIYVWDGLTMQTKHVLKGKLTKGIKCMAFSPSGKLLAAVDSSDEHQVAIFNVETGTCIGIGRGERNPIFEITFYGETELATVGVRHFKIWTIGKSLTSKSVKWGKITTDRSAACVITHNKFYLAGTTQGNLVSVEGENAIAAKKIHDGVIDTLRSTSGYIFTGGRDKVVHVLDGKSFEKLFQLSLSAQLTSVCGEPKAIDLDPKSGRLAIGTAGCEILLVGINLKSRTFEKPRAIVQGHYAPKKKDTNEVCGLCTIPGSDRYISVGDDATLRVYSADQRCQVHFVDLNRHKDGKALPLDPKTKEISNAAQARCIDVSFDGSLCAVGFRSGQVRIYDTRTWTLKRAEKEPMKE